MFSAGMAQSAISAVRSMPAAPARIAWRAALLGGLALALAGCATLARTPYSAADAADARVLDLDGLRRYADEPAAKFRLTN